MTSRATPPCFVPLRGRLPRAARLAAAPRPRAGAAPALLLALGLALAAPCAPLAAQPAPAGPPPAHVAPGDAPNDAQSGDARDQLAEHAEQDTQHDADDPRAAVPPADVGALGLDDQLRWLQGAARSGTLERLDDAQLITLFSSLDPRTLPHYIAAGPNGYPSYELTMLRKERIGGRWPAKADHMLVRISHEPLRIYAKWLPDGAHAGQEVIYDAAQRGDAMYGHLGGLLGMVPVWAQLDGAIARTQSRHRLTDLGTEYLARRFLAEGARFAQAGVAEPARIGVATEDGVRVVTFTWDAPPGSSGFYASRETLGLDLRHPWFRSARSYDAEGRLFEEVVFEHIEPKSFDTLTFDPKNPAYRF